ncbi:conserved hypothetical protein [Ricinus communis]|uniref:Uncharacterized protein n=1 Tax=Ricinus communis TaxID=3988 RepID=B9T672_RICCO|nr:conserved hypothetical protein [Ricinus communis]
MVYLGSPLSATSTWTASCLHLALQTVPYTSTTIDHPILSRKSAHMSRPDNGWLLVR